MDGAIAFQVKLDGETILEMEPEFGYLHRCFEKHAENVDYPGVMPYADRMDYCAAVSNGLGYCLAVEKLIDVEAPERAQVLRVDDGAVLET